MPRPLQFLVVLLASLALVGAGCGGDEGGGGDGGGGGNTPTVDDDARQRCLDEAERLPEGPARDAAEDACRGDTPNPGQDARQECLDQARQLPEPARSQAESACESAGGGGG